MPADNDPQLRIEKLGPLGSWANNAYLLVDTASNDSLVIDAPEGSEAIIEAASGTTVRGILVTHSHVDHIARIELLQGALDAPVYCHPAEAWEDRPGFVAPIDDASEWEFGNLRLRAIVTPGHTPGSTCFLIDEHLFSGDTLFPGGPGRTRRPEDLQQEIASITSRLYTLDDGIAVHPGHGDDTTIGQSRGEYAVFSSRQHDPGLHGDVLWLDA